MAPAEQNGGDFIGYGILHTITYSSNDIARCSRAPLSCDSSVSSPEPSGSQGYGQPPMQGGPPPQGGYYPQPGAPGQGQPTTVVVQQPTVAVVQTFRESPVHTRCPHCQAEVVTGTTYETGTFAWIICVVLCVIGCDLGCCLIPFCVDGCKDVVHVCPNCRQQIARWSRM